MKQFQDFHKTHRYQTKQISHQIKSTFSKYLKPTPQTTNPNRPIPPTTHQKRIHRNPLQNRQTRQLQHETPILQRRRPTEPLFRRHLSHGPPQPHSRRTPQHQPKQHSQRNRRQREENARARTRGDVPGK